MQLSRWPSYDAPRPAVMSACNHISVVRSCYAVWSTLPRPHVHWRTADHSIMMAGRRGAVISWRHSSSIVCVAAVSQATQAGTSMHVMNALGPLLNTCTSHSPSSTIAVKVECYLATPAVDLWREKMNSAFLASRVSPSPRCFRPKMAWCLRILIFPSVHYVYYLLPSARFLHDDVIRSSAVNLHLTFDLGSAHHSLISSSM